VQKRLDASVDMIIHGDGAALWGFGAASSELN
jgi:hypothetical protein